PYPPYSSKAIYTNLFTPPRTVDKIVDEKFRSSISSASSAHYQFFCDENFRFRNSSAGSARYRFFLSREFSFPKFKRGFRTLSAFFVTRIFVSEIQKPVPHVIGF